MDISLPKDVEEDLTLWEKMVVIGNFIGDRVSREKTKKWMENNWNKEVIIKFNHKNFFIIIF